MSTICILALATAQISLAQFVLDNGQGRVESGQILFTWGRNDFSQLGGASCSKDALLPVWNCEPDTENRKTPTAVPFLGYKKIHRTWLGDSISMVQLAEHDEVYSWGQGGFIGRLQPNSFSGVPALVNELKGSTKLSAGVKHAVSILPAQQGDAFEYDDFQNFHEEFNFVGDAAPSFSSPLACPRCVAWEDAKPQPIGFPPITGYACHAPVWGPTSRAWCYIGVFDAPPCKLAIADDLVDPQGGNQPPDRASNATSARGQETLVSRALRTHFIACCIALASLCLLTSGACKAALVAGSAPSASITAACCSPLTPPSPTAAVAPQLQTCTQPRNSCCTLEPQFSTPYLNP